MFREATRVSAPRCVVVPVLVAAGMLLGSPSVASAQSEPYAAIVMCEDSYDWSWEDTHSGAQGLIGLAGLVGTPYETLLLSELLAIPNPTYTSIWFSQCPVLTDVNYAAVDAYLSDYVGAGGNVFLDGPIGLYRPDPMGEFGVSYRGTDSLATTLKVIDGGWFPIAGYTVSVADADHPVLDRVGLATATQLSQGIIDGVETVDLVSHLDPDGAVLLDVTSDEDTLAYPYLVATLTDGGGKVVGVSGYANYVSAASSFHNEPPNVYFDNQVLPYIIEAVLWMEQSGSNPSVGLQLSHAPVTAIGRLDGDWSNEPTPTEATFLYLIDAAENIGLATVYGIVSSFVPDGGWERFSNGGVLLERYGGAIASHSHTHNNEMSQTLDDAGWTAEVTDSLAMIRSNVAQSGFDPAVDVFINPGDTIRQADYYRFFGDIELYMSHGFETNVPYSSGVLDFGLPDGMETVIVNDTPAPDFQWLYLEDWLYTVDQATELQSEILDYYQNTVRRGVLYNQMWHDYAIGANLEPVNFPQSADVRPLFDANMAHFAESEVYFPSVHELIGKYHIANKARHSSTRSGDTITVVIDYTPVPDKYRGFENGMGVRINDAGGAINHVTVDGVEHPAFTDNTVILPSASGTTQTISVDIGAAPTHPRLSFSSKPIGQVSLAGDVLTFGWDSTSDYRRGCVTGPEGTILLHSDILRRTSRNVVCAESPPDSSRNAVSTTVVDAGTAGFFVDGANRPIESASIDGLTVTMTTAAGEGDGLLDIRTGGPPISVKVDGNEVSVDHNNGRFDLGVPATPATITIQLRPCTDADGDGITDCAGDCDDNDEEIGICETGGCCRAAGSGPGGGWLLLILIVLIALRRPAHSSRFAG